MMKVDIIVITVIMMYDNNVIIHSSGELAIMVRAKVTRDMVFAAADELRSLGIRPSSLNVQKKIGCGSFTTIKNHLNAWEELNPQTEVLPGLAFDIPTDIRNDLDLLVTKIYNQFAKREETEKVKAIEEQLQEAIQENEQITQENQRLKGFESAYQILQDKLDLAIRENENMRRGINPDSADLVEQLENANRELEKAKIQLETENSRLQKMANSYQLQLDAKEKIIKESEPQRLEAIANFTRVQERENFATQRLRNFESRHEELQANFLELTQQKEDLDKQKTELESQNKELERQLKENSAYSLEDYEAKSNQLWQIENKLSKVVEEKDKIAKEFEQYKQAEDARYKETEQGQLEEILDRLEQEKDEYYQQLQEEILKNQDLEAKLNAANIELGNKSGKWSEDSDNDLRNKKLAELKKIANQKGINEDMVSEFGNRSKKESWVQAIEFNSRQFQIPGLEE